MIHEAIAALMGYEGNFFADDVRAQGSVLDFHPCELQLLNRIHSIGLKYKSLNDFATKNFYQSCCGTSLGKESNDLEVKQHAYGMYMHAYCNGVSRLLQPYVNDVIELEKKALHDPYFTLSDLLSRVQKYDSVFRMLITTTDEVTQQKLNGIYLLTFLNRKLNTCIGDQRAAIECLLHYCHKVLLTQLTSWLLYGSIMGDHNEFFIQKKQDNPRSESSESGISESGAATTLNLAAPSSVHSTTGITVQSKAPSSVHSSETDFVNTEGAGPENCTQTRYTTPVIPSGSKNEAQSGRLKSEEDIYQYEICFEKLPPYIMPSLAHNILSIGETIMMFSGDGRQDKNAGNSKLKTRSALGFSEVTDVNGSSSHAVWGNKELNFLNRLQKLQNARSLCITTLEETIDDIRMCLAQHLWQLAVDKAELFTQFKLIKDFFLLGRGELFLEFIHLASNMLQKTPTNKSERELNSAFQIAALKVMLNDESAMDKFKFHLPVPCSTAPNEEFVVGWSVVGLTYRVTWPLHFIFTKEVLKNYNELFRFLLRVKKVQMEVHSIWIAHLQSRMKCKPDVWQLHRNLMFLVDNLQYYLQVDVLESQYMLLQAKINETKNFEVVKAAHILFQTNILSQSFLLMERGAGQEAEGSMRNNSVHKCLCLFLELCEEFCSNVDQWSADQEFEQLAGMVQRCNWLIRLLLEMLTGLRTHPCGTYLSQLLLRLNYNHWFHKKADLSTSVANSSLTSSFAEPALSLAVST